MENIKKKLQDRKIQEYESDTIEMYKMISEEFNFEDLRNTSEFFHVKKYKNSIYRGELH